MDNTLWQELVEQLYDPIFRFAVHMLGSYEDAEDVTQQSFLKAFHSVHQLDDPTKAKAWLYAIARNQCHDHLRSLKRFFSLRALLPQERCIEMLSPIGHELLRAIGSLPRMQREVFLLREWHDFSTVETAQLLGIAEGSVKSHLHRAKSALRQCLGEQNAESPANLDEEED
ncbi:MAG: RNA polymerase sigma factor [Bdellovibrionota bacterium]|nr:MAG: RNA polymerase sigma factor [Bdellovibrionota bacterium]